jgi:hypothetical protein
MTMLPYVMGNQAEPTKVSLSLPYYLRADFPEEPMATCCEDTSRLQSL